MLLPRVIAAVLARSAGHPVRSAPQRVERPGEQTCDPHGGRRQPDAGHPAAWQERALPDLTAAEELLDWLDARGVTERELVVCADSTFAVRWQ